jgi:hypothetical protein
MSDTPKYPPQVRVNKNHVERIQRIVNLEKQGTSSSFASVTNEIIRAGLPVVEKRLGIKIGKL